jgi:hypothetical protein
MRSVPTPLRQNFDVANADQSSPTLLALSACFSGGGFQPIAPRSWGQSWCPGSWWRESLSESPDRVIHPGAANRLRPCGASGSRRRSKEREKEDSCGTAAVATFQSMPSFDRMLQDYQNNYELLYLYERVKK